MKCKMILVYIKWLILHNLHFAVMKKCYCSKSDYSNTVMSIKEMKKASFEFLKWLAYCLVLKRSECKCDTYRRLNVCWRCNRFVVIDDSRIIVVVVRFFAVVIVIVVLVVALAADVGSVANVAFHKVIYISDKTIFGHWNIKDRALHIQITFTF